MRPKDSLRKVLSQMTEGVNCDKLDIKTLRSLLMITRRMYVYYLLFIYNSSSNMLPHHWPLINEALTVCEL